MANQKQNWPKALANAVNLGTSVAMTFAVCLIGGQWLDRKFGTEPWLMIAGMILAILTSGKMMWERLMADNKNNNINSDQNKKDQS